jgi:hypothetical protein
MKAVLKLLAGSRSAQFATLLGVVAVVAGFTFLGLWLSGGGTEPAQSEPVPPPLTAADFWPDKQGVLHFCAVPGDQPDWPAGWCATEIWFDPRNQRARADVHDKSGTLESIVLVDGDVSAEYKRDNSLYIRRVLNGGDFYWQQWLVRDDHFVAFEPWVTRGKAGMTETTVEGVAALKVNAPGRDDTGKLIANRTIFLDKETHLPLRIEIEPTADAPDSLKGGVQTFAYRVVEWLPPQQVKPSPFTSPQDLPPVPRSERDWEMTVDEARGFSKFDV